MAFKPVCIALDLEFNQPSGKIIQVGLAAGDLSSGALVDTFSRYVRLDEPLAPSIGELCGITPDMLDSAPCLDEVEREMRQWLAPYADTRQLNPLTWGGGDSQTLRAQLGQEDERWPFGRRWVDVKTVFVALQHSRGRNAAGGLSSSLRKVGLQFDGRPHDARDDAVNTWRMYVRLLELIRA